MAAGLEGAGCDAPTRTPKMPVAHDAPGAGSPASPQELEKRKRALCRLLCLRDLTSRDTQLAPVAPGLFVGAMGAAGNLAGLQAAGVTYILNLSGLVPCFFPKQFRYLRLPLYDDPAEDIAQYFPLINRFIGKGRRRGAVLVHCFAGQSRSVAAVLAYLVGTQGLSLAAALQLVTAARPSAKPNTGFLAQLEAYAAAQTGAAELRPDSPAATAS